MGTAPQPVEDGLEAPLLTLRENPIERDFALAFTNALVARMDRPPSSKRTHAGSNPAESSGRIAQRIEHPDPGREVEGLSPSAITKFGELAERQGIAVLTRRDLRVGQVRLLHSPPIALRQSAGLA